ncbi:MAG: bifunctional 4-hydroxy-2-oxoglutarate aldolase/2-dehydro-3-deoxy-phosphogluconate aldolase [Bacteroidota bacterium]
MTNVKKHICLDAIRKQKIIPLFYQADFDIACEILKACAVGGAYVIEFTNRGDFAHEIFGQLVKFARTELPEMILGIGSVTDAATASLYMQLGANFIVSASLRKDIAKVCNRRKIPYLPGCGSLTEIGEAEELGCDIVKLFPGSTYGPGFIKAVSGPQSWTEIMVTGGVSPDKENLSSWFQSGAVAVGMGSKLIRKDWVQQKQFDKITAGIKESFSMI